PERVADVARLLTGEPVEAVLGTPLDAAYAPIIDVGAGRLDLLGRAGVSQVALVPGLVLDEPWAEPLLAVGATETYRGADGTLVVLPDAGPRLVGGTTEVATRRDALAAFAGGSWDHTASVLLEPDQAGRLDGAPLPGEDGPAGVVVEASRGTNS